MRQLSALRRSFRCAFWGLWRCVREERNLRIHLSAAGGALLFAGFCRFPAGQWALLILLIALVISAELMNSALERAVDLASPQRCPLARDAKDMAAGAVLVAAAAAAAIGLLLFLHPERLCSLWRLMQEKPLLFWPCVLGYAGGAVGFIFGRWKDETA